MYIRIHIVPEYPLSILTRRPKFFRTRHARIDDSSVICILPDALSYRTACSLPRILDIPLSIAYIYTIHSHDHFRYISYIP